MKSIAAKMVAVTIALGASSAACAAVNLHGEAGAEFTNLSASFGAGEPGMTFSSQWAHSDNDGDSVGPVSYTHLDVYKRQASSRPSISSSSFIGT